jgi:hypothetical protein
MERHSGTFFESTQRGTVHHTLAETRDLSVFFAYSGGKILVSKKNNRNRKKGPGSSDLDF